MPTITRRDWMAWFGGLFPAAMLLGCQKNTGNAFEDAPGPDAPPGTPVTIIVDNPGHAPHKLVIPATDVAVGATKMYDITNCANHCHTVTVTAANFAALSNGMTITLMATPDVQPPADCADPNVHSHTVLIALNKCPETTLDACEPIENCIPNSCDTGGVCPS
jgi:hypothetical protein